MRSDKPEPAAQPSREARLARALRDNLRRRKAPPTKTPRGAPDPDSGEESR
jgi:hypothetical protein